MNQVETLSDKERLERLANLSFSGRVHLALQKFRENPLEMEYLLRGLLLSRLGYFESEGYPRVSKGTIINNQGKITLGKGAKLEGCHIAVPPKGELWIGEFAAIGPETRVNVGDTVVIGARSLVAWGVDVLGQSFHQIAYADGRISELARPVSIGSDVWIQTKAIICPGARIGDGSVVAAGAVVPGKEYPPNVVLAGNPAKVIAEGITWKR